MIPETSASVSRCSPGCLGGVRMCQAGSECVSAWRRREGRGYGEGAGEGMTKP